MADFRNICVGLRISTLKILNVFMWLKFSPVLILQKFSHPWTGANLKISQPYVYRELQETSMTRNGIRKATLEALTAFIHTLSLRSGDVIRPYFLNRDFDVEIKDDQTPVTQADRKAEEVMRDLIAKTYPGHGIIGEEFGNENESAEFVWVLDPIDGTISFASGCPLFGTLIGLIHNGRPILGAIHNPILDRLCIGNNNETSLNGKPVRLRSVGGLSKAILLATDIAHVSEYRNRENFDRLLSQTRLFRTWGDCYGYLLLVSGGADIMLDPILKPWDLIPLIPVIQGAGGVITTWSGADAFDGNSCVAASQALHAQVIDILNG
jgi:myo-inositol-1(or 4)-monophosphatase